MEYRSFSAIVRIYLTLLVTWTTFISTASRVHTRQPLLLCFYLRLLKGFATFAFDLLPGMHLETAYIYIYIYIYSFLSPSANCRLVSCRSSCAVDRNFRCVRYSFLSTLLQYMYVYSYYSNVLACFSVELMFLSKGSERRRHYNISRTA